MTATRTVRRIVRKTFAKTAFTGDGARLHGGRWNSIGVPMVYTSGSVASATLEMLVHLDSEDGLSDFRLFRIELPATAIEIPSAKKLPVGWDRDQPSDAVRRFGTNWLVSGRSLALCVPSAVVPHEFNYLLNPLHPGFAGLKIGRAEKFAFDARLTSYPSV